MFRKLLLSLIVSAGLLASARAGAQELRLPTDGTPAFDLVLPSGWTSLIDEWGNMRLTRDNRSAAV